MCFLDFDSSSRRRRRRNASINQSSKKIHKKKHQSNKKRNLPSPIRKTIDPEYSDYDGLCFLDGRFVNKRPPPPATITWRWNTGKQEDARNWLQLPPDITLRVFTKLETLDILLTVSQVCSSWRHLSKEPILYRSVVIGGYDLIFRGRWLKGFMKVFRNAGDRSCGKLAQFSCGNMVAFYLNDLRYVVESSSSLKSLRLGLCIEIDNEEILELLKKTPCLEELYLHVEYCQLSMFRDIGCFCPKLKYLQIGAFHEDSDMRALEIAECLHNLRGLRFLANGLTNNGLQAILDRCSRLEYVYLRGFSNLDGGLLKKHCDRIKSMTVLNKSTSSAEEIELHLKASSDGQSLIGMFEVVEEDGDYSPLPLYKSSFEDYISPSFWERNSSFS